MYRLKPTACSAVIVGGIDSSCRLTTTSTSAGPSCAKAASSAGRRSFGILDAGAENPGGLGELGEVRVDQVGAVGEPPGRLHLQLDEAERAVVEHHDLDRQVELPEREQVAEQHREPAVAGQADHLPAGQAACAPIACGRAFAIDPWMNEPSSRRLPFILR